MATPKYYYIKSQMAGTLLMTVDPSHKVILQKAPETPGDNQKWSKKDNGDGTYYLVSKQVGRNLQMGEENAQATVTNIGGSSVQFPNTTDANLFNIQDVSTNLVLGVPDSKTTPPPVKSVLYTGAKAQVWQFEPVS